VPAPQSRGESPVRSSIDPVTLKDLESTIPGCVEGSAIEVIALRGDAATGQLEIAEVRDNSLALGAIPAKPARRIVPPPSFGRGPSGLPTSVGSPSCFTGPVAMPHAAGAAKSSNISNG
jgi:hypothetical protein